MVKTCSNIKLNINKRSEIQAFSYNRIFFFIKMIFYDKNIGKC